VVVSQLKTPGRRTSPVRAIEGAIRLLDQLALGDILEQSLGEVSNLFTENKLDGGGGGSRTRVREYVPTGIYMRVRALNFTTRVKAWPKPPVAERR